MIFLWRGLDGSSIKIHVKMPFPHTTISHGTFEGEGHHEATDASLVRCGARHPSINAAPPANFSPGAVHLTPSLLPRSCSSGPLFDVFFFFCVSLIDYVLLHLLRTAHSASCAISVRTVPAAHTDMYEMLASICSTHVGTFFS